MCECITQREATQQTGGVTVWHGRANSSQEQVASWYAPSRRVHVTVIAIPLTLRVASAVSLQGLRSCSAMLLTVRCSLSRPVPAAYCRPLHVTPTPPAPPLSALVVMPAAIALRESRAVDDPIVHRRRRISRGRGHSHTPGLSNVTRPVLEVCRT